MATTRLLQAIVGVGIAIGAAACGGALDDSLDGSAEREDTGPFDATADATVDAQLIDAGASDAHVKDVAANQDVVADVKPDVIDAAVLADAFCDAGWPTTKGHDSRCALLISPHVCADTATAPICSNNAWVCPPGTADRYAWHTDAGRECWCFGPLPPGAVCTDGGVVGADGGH